MRTAWICLVALFPANALAGESPSMATAALQTLWALLIVVCLILALYALARKRLMAGKLGGNNIQVIEIRPLGPKATLALVEVRGREYLLAINAGEIRLLAEPSRGKQNNETDFHSILAESK